LIIGLIMLGMALGSLLTAIAFKGHAERAKRKTLHTQE